MRKCDVLVTLHSADKELEGSDLLGQNSLLQVVQMGFKNSLWLLHNPTRPTLGQMQYWTPVTECCINTNICRDCGLSVWLPPLL